MEATPALPSPTGSTVCSLTDSTASPSPATSSASASSGSSTDSSCACTPRANPACHTTDFFVQEIQAIREAWFQERQRYRVTDLELQRVAKLLEACDACYQCLVQAALSDPEAPLSAMAAAVLEKWAHNEMEDRLDVLNAQLDQRSTEFKEKCKQFLFTNRMYSNAAKAYFLEVEKFATWTAARSCKLQSDYQKYCQIMKEQGAVPEVLYENDLCLDKMAEDFYEAWDARESALSQAMAIAQLDGRPDILEGLFTH